ncbi:probable carboxylesterase 5 [Ananas comosus]|uniref:Probable carboxylesterase 5 n=1 Tax=Ananas comosus TaxID=4615 RepID=A0A6P5F303_ANACO|nr:probable carboxylesterase 5 [Ananas comosus]
MARCSLVPFVLFSCFSLLYLFTKEWIPPSPSPHPSFSPQIQTLTLTPTRSSDPSRSKDLDAEVEFDFAPFVRVYKSGRVERLHGTATVPAGLDPSTGVASRDVAIDPATGLAARLFLPADLVPGGGGEGGGARVPIVVYFHGGAFVIESAFSPFYHNYLNALASRARALAVSVEYRLAPEHPLPAAYADAWAALRWAFAGGGGGGDRWVAARGDPARVFLAGDSAGANIAHNAAARAGKGKVRVEGLVLQNPYFWGREAVGREPRERWIREGMERSWGFVCAGAMGIDDPAVNPMGASGMGMGGWGMRRALVTVAGRDVFRERGLAYAEGLRRSGGGGVEVYEAEGEPHVYFVSNPWSPAAAKEIDVLVSFIHRR